MSQGMWPQGGYGPGYGQPPPSQQPPPQQAPAQQRVRAVPTLPPPVAFEAVAGTPYGVAMLGVAPTTSGPAVASLVTGVAAILVSLVVGCFGAIGGSPGWGPIVAGAFAVLATFLGVAAVSLSQVGLRQIRRGSGWSRATGRGLAIAGMICGAVGLLFTVLSFVGALVLASRALVD